MEEEEEEREDEREREERGERRRKRERRTRKKEKERKKEGQERERGGENDTTLQGELLESRPTAGAGQDTHRVVVQGGNVVQVQDAELAQRHGSLLQADDRVELVECQGARGEGRDAQHAKIAELASQGAPQPLALRLVELPHRHELALEAEHHRQQGGQVQLFGRGGEQRGRR